MARRCVCVCASGLTCFAAAGSTRAAVAAASTAPVTVVFATLSSGSSTAAAQPVAHSGADG